MPRSLDLQMGNILDQALSKSYLTDVEMLIKLSWQKHKPEPAPVENVIEARSNFIPLSLQPHGAVGLAIAL